MTRGAVQRDRFRFSVRSLMIAVVVCALSLVPIGWLARRNLLLEARRMRAEAEQARAIALAERARAEYLARVRAEGTAWNGTKTDPAVEPEKSLSGAGLGLWAALAVNHAVFRHEDTKDLNVEFTLINDGEEVLEPRIDESRIIINGRELADSRLILSHGPRDARFEVMRPGEHLQFVYALGKYFEEPGIYRISWRGVSFRSPEVVFRVLPNKTGSTGAH